MGLPRPCVDTHTSRLLSCTALYDGLAGTQSTGGLPELHTHDTSVLLAAGRGWVPRVRGRLETRARGQSATPH